MKNEKKIFLGGVHDCYSCKKSFEYILNKMEVMQENYFPINGHEFKKGSLNLNMVSFLCDDCFEDLKNNEMFNDFLSEYQKKNYIKREEFQ